MHTTWEKAETAAGVGRGSGCDKKVTTPAQSASLCKLTAHNHTHDDEVTYLNTMERKLKNTSLSTIKGYVVSLKRNGFQNGTHNHLNDIIKLTPSLLEMFPFSQKRNPVYLFKITFRFGTQITIINILVLMLAGNTMSKYENSCYRLTCQRKGTEYFLRSFILFRPWSRPNHPLPSPAHSPSFHYQSSRTVGRVRITNCPYFDYHLPHIFPSTCFKYFPTAASRICQHQIQIFPLACLNYSHHPPHENQSLSST